MALAWQQKNKLFHVMIYSMGLPGLHQAGHIRFGQKFPRAATSLFLMASGAGLRKMLMPSKNGVFAKFPQYKLW